MAYIDPDGLFHGDRMALLSDEARLMWPYFWCASNTCGRIELNYHKVLARAFHRFKQPPSEARFWKWIEEYWQASLLFVYQKDGHTWGQWEVSERYLPRHKLASDKRTPAPDHAEFAAWRDLYISSKIRKSAKSFPITNSAHFEKSCVDKEKEVEVEVEKEVERKENPPLPPKPPTPIRSKEPDFPPFRDDEFDLEPWFEQRYRRHPKKKNRPLALRLLGELQELQDPAWRAEFERVHELWIADESWQWKAGASAPDLAQWVMDKGWKYPPARASPAPSIPDPPSMISIWKAEKAAAEARGEEY